MISDRPQAKAVLVVDDDGQVRTLLARMLRRRGIEVLEAANGAEALSVVRTYRDALPVLLVDVKLGNESGIAVALQVQHERPDVRVFLMSGYSADELAGFPKIAGAVYLHKPFNMGELTEKIVAALKDATQP